MQRQWTLEFHPRKKSKESGPTDHALPQRHPTSLPDPVSFFPNEVLDRNHFQSSGETLERLTPDRAITPDQLCEETKEPTVFVGNGLDSYGTLLASRIGKNFLPVPKNTSFTVAALAARLAEKKFQTDKCFNLRELNIKYVRKPEAELKFAKLRATSKEKSYYGNRKGSTR